MQSVVLAHFISNCLEIAQSILKITQSQKLQRYFSSGPVNFVSIHFLQQGHHRIGMSKTKWRTKKEGASSRTRNSCIHIWKHSKHIVWNISKNKCKPFTHSQSTCHLHSCMWSATCFLDSHQSIVFLNYIMVAKWWEETLVGHAKLHGVSW